jgi:hypothetical protein
MRRAAPPEKEKDNPASAEGEWHGLLAAASFS